MTTKKKILWHTLEHAYGQADDIPPLLAQLNEPDQQAAALEALSLRLYHQGTIYSATQAAIPVLLELLTGDFPHKIAVLHLLTLIAETYASKRYPTLTSSGDDDERTPPTPLETACYKAIQKGMPSITPLLEDSTLHAAVIGLLMLLPQKGEHIHLILLEKLKQQPTARDLDQWLRLMRSKKHPLQPEHFQLLEALVEKNLDPALTVMAVTELLHRTGEAVAPAMVDALTNSITQALFYWDTDRVFDGLAKLSPERHRHALISLFSGQREGSYAFAHSHLIARELLAVTFGCPQLRHLHSTTLYDSSIPEGQARMYETPKKPCPMVAAFPIAEVITALLQDRAFWMYPHNLLSMVGWPDTPAELQAKADSPR